MAMTPVTTRSYDNSRSGSNLQETILTQAKVGTQGIRRLFSLSLPNDARGCEAQPLIVPNVMMDDGLHHDLCLVATMANYVAAYDAHSGELLWMTLIGDPIDNSKALDYYLINDHWGILSTPVVDLDNNILYCCVWSSPDGTPESAEFWLHALDIIDGSAAVAPIDLNTLTYAPGNGLPVQKFSTIMRKQRASLLLTDVVDSAGVQHKTVFIAFGTVSESQGSARGWLVACSVVPTMRVTAAWTATSRYSGAGIWQSGQGPAADAAGDIYVMTGNGAFDGVTDFGEAFVKLRYTPPTATAAGSIQAIDWFSPFSDAGRVGQTQSNPQINVTATAAVEHHLPSNVRRQVHLDMVGNPMDWNDQDLGSSGPLLIPELNLVLGAGKDGILYVLDADKLGRTQRTMFDTPAVNYALLKSPPIWYTFYPGNGISAAPDKFTDLNINHANRTHNLHGGSVFYHSSVHGPMVFCWGENGNLRAWSVAATGKVTYLACSAEMASPQAPVPPGGMPGGMLCLSANERVPGTAILWALVPFGDGNSKVTGGTLYAYDAENFAQFANHGGNQLKVLWSSADWGITFSFNKFNTPVVSGGKIFIPTYDGTVDVYGLA